MRIQGKLRLGFFDQEHVRSQASDIEEINGGEIEQRYQQHAAKDDASGQHFRKAERNRDYRTCNHEHNCVSDAEPGSGSC